MKLSSLSSVAVCLIGATSSVVGFPAWDSAARGFGGGLSLVAGADSLVAISPLRLHDRSKVLMSSGAPGANGYAYVMAHPDPPQYFISPPGAGQLYQLVNDSSILHVNIRNVTTAYRSPLPFKLAFGQKKEGVMDGWWSWTGTRLTYHHGSRTNMGLFYDCIDKSGTRSLYINLESIPTPGGCEMTTLHSLGRVKV